MCKKMLAGLFMLIFVLTCLNCVFAEEVVIKGTVEQVAADSSYIIVSGNKIFTTPGFIEEFDSEEGDEVEITAEKTAEGLKAINFSYLPYQEEAAEEEAAEEETTEKTE